MGGALGVFGEGGDKGSDGAAGMGKWALFASCHPQTLKEGKPRTVGEEKKQRNGDKRREQKRI